MVSPAPGAEDLALADPTFGLPLWGSSKWRPAIGDLKRTMGEENGESTLRLLWAPRK